MCECGRGYCTGCTKQGEDVATNMANGMATKDVKFIVFWQSYRNHFVRFDDEAKAREFAEIKARECKSQVVVAKVVASVATEQPPVRWTKVK